MTVGVHCAHFEMRKLGSAMVGVAGPGFDLAAGGDAAGSAEGWVMETDSGILCHGGDGSEWVGQPKRKDHTEPRRSRRATWWCGARPALRCAVGVLRGLVCACRAWCSTSTPAGQTHRPEVAS